MREEIGFTYHDWREIIWNSFTNLFVWQSQCEPDLRTRIKITEIDNKIIIEEIERSLC